MTGNAHQVRPSVRVCEGHVLPDNEADTDSEFFIFFTLCRYLE
jgi:hypothetical protein